MTNKNLHLFAPLALMVAFWTAACAAPTIIIESLTATGGLAVETVNVAVSIPPAMLGAMMP